MYGGRIIWELLNVNNNRTITIVEEKEMNAWKYCNNNNNHINLSGGETTTLKYKTVKDSYINNDYSKIPITTAKRTTTTSKFLANSCFHICTIGLPAIHPPPRRGAACRHLLQEEVLRAD